MWLSGGHKIMSVTQALKQRPRITYIEYGRKKIKVESYGSTNKKKAHKDISDSIFFLPKHYCEYLDHVEKIRIIKTNNNIHNAGTFTREKNVITIYEHTDSYDYSQTFMHELGHLIFIVLRKVCQDQENMVPLYVFSEAILKNEIKPISYYSNELLEKHEAHRAYMEELFAEWFGFTQARYTDYRMAIGSLENYINVNNACWDLYDTVHLHLLRDCREKNCHCKVYENEDWLMGKLRRIKSGKNDGF